MDRAAEAGIPVIAYDRLIGNDAVTYYISFDNYTVGVLQGKFIEAALGLKNANGKVFNIEFTAGDPADNNAGYFFRGGFDILKPYIDSGVLKVISGQTAFQQVATAQWSRIFSAHIMLTALSFMRGSATMTQLLPELHRLSSRTMQALTRLS